FAWLGGGGWRVDAARWQAFMHWGGWAQASAIAIWAFTGPGTRFVRAATTTLFLLVLAVVARWFSPLNASVYISLVVVQMVGIGAGLGAGRGLAALTRKNRTSASGEVWRYPLKLWFGWTTLVAVWATLLRFVPDGDLGTAPELGVCNLAGAPLLVLFAATQNRTTCRRSVAFALAAIGAAALAVLSVRLLYDGPWRGLVTARLVHVNVVQVAYLAAWRLILDLDAAASTLVTRNSRDGSASIPAK
ncbi:MAG: hypothetical protein KDA61_21340, partial [Planctomycetales bacterium]|nr:hypothetical protein [Planctomycetales bacterium]